MTIVNALTVDVEDYFQVSAFDRIVSRDEWPTYESRVCRNTERLLNILGDAGVRATFFVLGWVAERFPTLVRRIATGGHEVASHGYGHQLLYEQTPADFRADIRRSRAVIEDASGQRVWGYRAPSYSVTGGSLWALDVLIEEGFRYDASIFPVHHDRYGLPSWPRHVYRVWRPSGSLWEVPPTSVRYGGLNLPVAGGGYFRLLPYDVTRWALARVNTVERRPAVVYMHPWEIDPQQPRIATGWRTRFRHYVNLSRTEPRLRQLLRDFRFDSISAAMLPVPDAQETLH